MYSPQRAASSNLKGDGKGVVSKLFVTIVLGKEHNDQGVKNDA